MQGGTLQTRIIVLQVYNYDPILVIIMCFYLLQGQVLAFFEVYDA